MHIVACCWELLRINWKPVKLLSPVQTDATLLANNSQHCWMSHVASVCTPCWMFLCKVWNWSNFLSNNSQHFFCSVIAEALHNSSNIVGATHAHYAWITKTCRLYSSHNALQQLPTLLAQQCWELLRPFARSLSYVRTDATTPNNLGSCWLTMLRRPSARSLTFSAVPRFEWQTRVAKQWKSSVKKFSCVVNPWANDVTSPINAGSCWPKMLRPFSRGFSLDCFMSKAPCKRTNHCWPTTPNIDGSCCIRLHEAKSLTRFKLCATTCKRVSKMDVTCNT